MRVADSVSVKNGLTLCMNSTIDGNSEQMLMVCKTGKMDCDEKANSVRSCKIG